MYSSNKLLQKLTSLLVLLRKRENKKPYEHCFLTDKGTVQNPLLNQEGLQSATRRRKEGYISSAVCSSINGRGHGRQSCANA